ncbi:MAG: hypothetical protein JSU73_03935 [candidate division WOR-3 bacterium]|nr:MAG: hypothetical protein JSU73_03935 [candidate division WOR-3 bacterium]
MRRTLSVLVVLCAAAALLTMFSCQRLNALRIASINEDKPIEMDIADFASYVDEDGDRIYNFMIPNGIVPMEFQYVEIGLGQPGWTPNIVQIQEIRITYTFEKGEGEPPSEGYATVVQSVDFLVPSDPEGKDRTEVEVNIMPAWWISDYFEDEAEDEDPEFLEGYRTVAQLGAKIRAKGVDQTTDLEVEAETEVLVNVGTYYDDPDRYGQ